MPSSSSTVMPFSSMDPQLYLYAAKSEGILLGQFHSRLEIEITPQKNTALHIAAKFGQFEAVKEIHEHCTELLRRKNSKGDTSLHLAARNGFPNIVNFLIDQDKQQQKLISDDIERGRVMRSTTDHQEVAEIDDDESGQLIIRMRNNKKDTALHEAVRNHFLFDGQKEKQYLEVVKLLSEGDPDFQCVANDACETPLYIAAEEGLLDFVTQLVKDCSSSSHYCGPFGRSPLHAAAYGIHSRYLDVAKILLSKKPDLIREVDNDGWSPLHFAAFSGSLDMVKLLLKNDTTVAYLPDKEGISPIHIAAQKGHSYVIKELILQCPDCHELVDHQGRNALHFLTMYETYLPCNIKRMFKDIPIKDMANEVDNNDNTPLHFAAKRSNPIIAATILSLRIANTSALNNRSFTPLDIFSLETRLSLDLLRWFYKWGKFDTVRRRVRRMRQKETMKSNREIRDKGEFEGEIIGDKEKSDKLNDREKSDEPKDKETSEDKERNETTFLAATLIATVTFAAGLTMPGGFNNSSPDEGAATLAKNAAFQAFLIFNAAAMVFAISAIFLRFWSSIWDIPLVKTVLPGIAVDLNFYAIINMVIAFMTGTYAVLPTSKGLAVGVCVICSIFFLFIGFSYFFLRMLGRLRHEDDDDKVKD